MVRIIKHGNMPPHMFRGECEHCGMIAECDMRDLQRFTYDAYTTDTKGKLMCPDCGNIVLMSRLEVKDDE